MSNGYLGGGNEMRTYLATLRVHPRDKLHRIEVINPRVQTDLVHHHDSSCLHSIVELTNGRTNTARSGYMRLALDGCIDDRDVLVIRHQEDNEVVLRDHPL